MSEEPTTLESRDAAIQADKTAVEDRNVKLDDLLKAVKEWGEKRTLALKDELAWLKEVQAKLPGGGKSRSGIETLRTEYLENTQVKDFLP